jgi:hypothetical protein
VPSVSPLSQLNDEATIERTLRPPIPNLQ